MATAPLRLGLVAGIAFLLPGLLLLRSSVRRFQRADARSRARESSVADLTAGDLVTVSGTVEPLTDERVPAHFRGEEGVLVSTAVMRRRGRSGEYGGTGGWQTSRTHVDFVPFAVDDGTGRVPVRLPAPEAFTGGSGFWEALELSGLAYDDSDEAVAETAARFDAYAFDGETSIGETETTRRYVQGIAAPGDHVAVVGRVERDDERDTLVVDHGDDPATFALAVGENRTPSVRSPARGGIARAVLGVVLTGLGALLVALPWVSL